jgi:hypothetical protein
MKTSASLRAVIALLLIGAPLLRSVNSSRRPLCRRMQHPRLAATSAAIGWASLAAEGNRRRR